MGWFGVPNADNTNRLTSSTETETTALTANPIARPARDSVIRIISTNTTLPIGTFSYPNTACLPKSLTRKKVYKEWLKNNAIFIPASNVEQP